MTAAALPKRICTLLLLFFIVIIAIISLSDDAWSAVSAPLPQWHVPFTTDTGILSNWWGSKGRPLRIAIMEAVGTHDEVTAALVHAFGGHPNAQLTLYIKNQRYNMEAIMENLDLPSPIVAVESSDIFIDHAQGPHPPDILVSTTCEIDPERKPVAFRHLLARNTTHLFCVFHHADRWKRGRHVNVAREFLARDRVDFIGLSQHTVDYFLNETAANWATDDGAPPSIRAHAFPPVFPVDVPDLDPDAGPSLAMQGDYSSGRRDYKNIFQHLSNVIDRTHELSATTHDNETVSLRLIGHGKHPEVPAAVRDRVFFDEGLSYPDFYALLSQSFSVIPAFASDTYLDRKASSTVPASLIAGAPLVASEGLLAAYSYLPREAAWVAEPGEGEMDVIERVIGEKDEFRKKRKLVRQARDRLMKENRAHVREWIANVLKLHPLAEDEDVEEGGDKDAEAK
ncbi:hypothetical protein ACRALDRAFT_1066011 [Sodiomyces alcalophilus JCM 7366]|uniref:uncharacterized protein n=1 Tax=Sodiomyces alcalophilus JCM 7366 TaxID=591952 RepID=UPI0039B538D1